MDEPTARLAHDETATLFKIMKILKEKGVSIIYISHHMEEILQVADRVSVLRDGKVVGTVDKSGDVSFRRLFKWWWAKNFPTASLAP